eukprot:evm.model.scf_683EXC.2 EVM.evm.TU.scf_683EXC.2   scf_683EXC:18243-19586(+)
MSNVPIWAMILAKTDAISHWRSMMGPTCSETAREECPKSIRGLYGKDGTMNAVHGSDSAASAMREIQFFFPGAVLRGAPSSPEELGQWLGSASDYIAANLQPVLIKALTVLAKQKPSGEEFEVITFLANWLLANNPNKPRVVPPGAACDAMNVEEEVESERRDEDVAPVIPENKEEDSRFVRADSRAVSRYCR